jgi:hypothetical protein
MKQKDDLYKLIQAMSKSEKRYFTIDAKKSGRPSSNYLEVFHAINQMDEYDEQKLQKRFGKNLPSEKSYLYNAILRSMRDYRSSKSRAARIKEMVLDAKYLYERGLYSQSEARISQARELALELDDQLSLLEISREQLNYLWVTKPKGYGQRINELLEQKDIYIENINEELKYLAISYKIQMAKNKPDLDKYQEEISAQLFPGTHYPYAQSAHTRRRFFQSCAFYYDLIAKDVENANIYYSKMAEWWDDNPSIKEEEYVRYIADVFNLIHISYTQKKYQQFEKLLQKIETERPSNYHDQRLLFKQLTNYKLLYHVNLGVEEGHEVLIQQVEEGMGAYKLTPVSQLIIAFNLSLLLFILERFELCQQWCEKIMKDYNKKVNNEQFRLATLLINVLCSYEQEDIDRIDSGLRALQRSLKPSKYQGVFFKATTKALRKLENAMGAQASRLLIQLKQQIQQAKESGESIPLGMDDLLLNWIHSKQEQLPLRIVLRESIARA